METTDILELVGCGVIGLIAFIYIVSCLHAVQEYERLVVFRWGKFYRLAEPGLRFVPWPQGSYVNVSLRAFVLEVAKQDILTKDGATLQIVAVVRGKAKDPKLTVLEVEDWQRATLHLAQVTLRTVLGEYLLDEVLSDRERLSARLRKIIDETTEPWGIEVSAVEIKSLDLPAGVQRAMGQAAEAEREARAKVIVADGEFRAAAKLKEAADVIAANPMALQLRYLQTLQEVAVENNSTIVFPFPIDFLDAFKDLVKNKK